MKKRYSVAQMAMSPIYEENINKADALIEKAAKEGSALLLLPELFEGPYFCQIEDYEKFALAEEASNSKTLKHFQEMAEEFGIENDIRVSSLARFPDVLTMEEEPADPEGIWDNLQKALLEAVDMFDQARRREGEFLREDLNGKLDEMLGHVEFISERAPGLIETYRTSLQDKVVELLEASNIDDSRIAQEVTIYADKVCVDEELVRLRSHIEATREELSRGGSIGRKLDFIAQEMNRESNTILSKSDDREVSDHAIELKTSVEKIREQVQNIE